MARLFISHSSLNNNKAIEVRDWLAKNGWDDVFLDLDPERSALGKRRSAPARPPRCWSASTGSAIPSRRETRKSASAQGATRQGSYNDYD